MSFRVRILPGAAGQTRALVQWWRENRPAAPDAIKEEFERATEVLAQTPNIGSPYTRSRIAGVRRLALTKTPYHVYYRVDEKAGEVLVMAVWSSMRRQGPPLT